MFANSFKIRLRLAWFALGILAGQPALAELRSLGADLRVERLQPGVWLHSSRSPSTDGRQVWANGLLVSTGEISLLVDTGWTTDQTRRLMAWAANELGQPIEHVVLTHAHPDRWGGLAAFEGANVLVHAHAGTAQAAVAEGRGPLHWSFEFQERLDVGGEAVDLFYPGPGHTVDNIVVFLPRRRLLFGGCLVRSVAADGLGHTADADLGNWPVALRRVIERYREVDVVVPGHGAVGGVELLSRTMELLEQRLDPDVADRRQPTTR